MTTFQLMLILILIGLMTNFVVLSYFVVKLINKMLSYSIPWDKLEKINAGQNRPGFSFAEDNKKSSTFKKSAEVAELPPEVVAPSLKQMRKTSGF